MLLGPGGEAGPSGEVTVNRLPLEEEPVDAAEATDAAVADRASATCGASVRGVSAAALCAAASSSMWTTSETRSRRSSRPAQRPVAWSTTGADCTPCSISLRNACIGVSVEEISRIDRGGALEGAGAEVPLCSGLASAVESVPALCCCWSGLSSAAAEAAVSVVASAAETYDDVVAPERPPAGPAELFRADRNERPPLRAAAPAAVESAARGRMGMSLRASAHVRWASAARVLVRGVYVTGGSAANEDEAGIATEPDEAEPEPDAEEAEVEEGVAGAAGGVTPRCRPGDEGGCCCCCGC